MAKDYSQRIPSDRDGTPMTGLPVPFPAIVTTAREAAATSSVTALNANTTLLEVAAIGGTGYIRWAGNQAASVVAGPTTTANFDNVIPAGTVRQFVIPRSVMAIPNYNANGSPSIVGMGQAEGLFRNVATMGVASVLVTEY